MAATHRDLPPGSQKWADEMDALREEVKVLKALCARMAQDLRIDPRDPSKNMNPQSDSPTVASPVQQKLSSLGDTDTYNVAEGQVLAWNQQKQAWTAKDLPAAPGGDSIDVSSVSYSKQTRGDGVLQDSSNYAYHAAYTDDQGYRASAETWSTKKVYIGAGSWQANTYSMIEMDRDGFGRPYVQIDAYDDADGTYGDVVVFSYGVAFHVPRIMLPHCATANRPTGLGSNENDMAAMLFDVTLGKPIFWNGTAWVDALGTAV